jgi:hypothetical protein
LNPTPALACRKTVPLVLRAAGPWTFLQIFDGVGSSILRDRRAQGKKNCRPNFHPGVVSVEYTFTPLVAGDGAEGAGRAGRGGKTTCNDCAILLYLLFPQVGSASVAQW